MFNTVTAAGKVSDLETVNGQVKLKLVCKFWQRDSRPATLACVFSSRQADQVQRNVKNGRTITVVGRLQDNQTSDGLELIVNDFYYLDSAPGAGNQKQSDTPVMETGNANDKRYKADKVVELEEVDLNIPF